MSTKGIVVSRIRENQSRGSLHMPKESVTQHPSIPNSEYKSLLAGSNETRTRDESTPKTNAKNSNA